jgi:transcriptional regulator with XRE-family HTH domain
MAQNRVSGRNIAAGTLKDKKKEGGRLSPALEDGLRSYAIAERLRALRLKKKMGLVELGQHTGLSPALLSKLERGRLFPTLPTLLRIAMVFSVDLQYFFAGPRERPVVAIVRRKDRVRLPDTPGTPHVNFFFESLDFPAAERRLNAYYADFPPVAEEHVRPHAHAGAEVVYVLTGCLELRVGEQTHVLDAGDSIYFDSGIPHAYRRHDRQPCAAMIVTTA